MSNPMRFRADIGVRDKRRLVKKTRWELPSGDSKPYWDAICKDIESKVSMTVRNPLFPNPISYPPTIPSSNSSSIASSVNRDDRSICEKNSDISQPTAKAINIISPSANAVTSPKLSSGNVKCNEDQLDDISSSSFGLTKLSKMTRLVNNFLSNIRPRVVQCNSVESKKNLSRTKAKENNRNIAAALMTEKSFNERSKDETSGPDSFARDVTRTEKSTAETVTSGHPISNKKSVIFRDTFEATIERELKPEHGNIPEEKPRRARAPSLSIASAVPSFGKIVISIEDIDFIENEEKHVNPSGLPNALTSRDYREKIEPDDSQDCDGKTAHYFLRVPQIRTAEPASYPVYDESKYEQLKNLNARRLMDEAYESELLRETQMFKKSMKLWPKRSIVNVFRAVKGMRRGLRTKARIESETNQFFAAPLEIYSPSARSSVTSDDQMDFVESNVPASMSDPDDDEIMMERDYDGNEWREKIDKGSNASSYSSVRKRLMRNAVAHLSKDSQHDAAGTCIDISNAPEVTFEQADPSSSYTSWATSKNEVTVRRRNKKTAARHFIGIPRLNRIFPRVKADKCLACMCLSLGDIHQPRPRKKASLLWTDRVNNDLKPAYPTGSQLSSELLNLDSSTTILLDQFDRDRYRSYFTTGKAMARLKTDDHETEASIAGIPNDQVPPEDSGSFMAQQSVIEASKNTPQVNDLHRSRALEKSPTKILVTDQTLITAQMSDRTRSISDQDDSDQGYVESGENEAGVGGGATMKNLAPCHMPINLKPSLEPLKALRNKKSRSIRSRVASAEKSGNSADDDENDSDYDENIGRQSLNEVSKKLDTLSDARGEKSQKIGADGSVLNSKETHVYSEESIADTEETTTNDIDPHGNMKTDLTNDSTIISDSEVIEISKRCLANGMTIADILRELVNEYSNRLASRHLRGNCSPRLSNAGDNEKKAINLMTLLAESKSYSNCGKLSNDPPDLLFSSEQPSLCNARQLRRILPLKSYNLVAPILGMAKWYPTRKMTTLREVAKKAPRPEPSETSKEDEFDLIVHPPSRLELNVSFEKNRNEDHPKLNPYSLFLIKPRRKAVTWRPLTERDLEGYDPEATLKKRAARITDRICEDFCQWLESLAAGTNRTSGIDKEVLKDMFETDFTAEVCKTMQVCIKEMPMVPTAVALARNCPDATELALTRKYLAKDAKAEMESTEMAGFGSSLPSHRRFKPPRNQVDQKWLQCENVPVDLETMDVVWKGITHLESVKGFAKWLKLHPEIKRPKGLEKLLSSRQAVGPKKSAITDFTDQELDLDQIQSLRVADNAEETS